MTSCGIFTCYGDDYCCQDDDGTQYCCYSYSLYQRWWFWFLWGMILLVGFSCCIGCYRACQSRRRARYVILRQDQQPSVYGSVVVTSNGSRIAPPPNYVGMPAPGYAPTSSGPVRPPPYAAYPQEKPPEYTASAPKLPEYGSEQP